MHHLIYNGSMKIDIMQIHAILPIYWSMEIIQPRKGMPNSNISHNIKISVVNKDRIFVPIIYSTKNFFALTHCIRNYIIQPRKQRSSSYEHKCIFLYLHSNTIQGSIIIFQFPGDIKLQTFFM